MTEANYEVGNATAKFQSVWHSTFGIRTLAGSTIEVGHLHFVSFDSRNWAFGMRPSPRLAASAFLLVDELPAKELATLWNRLRSDNLPVEVNRQQPKLELMDTNIQNVVLAVVANGVTAMLGQAGRRAHKLIVGEKEQKADL